MAAIIVEPLISSVITIAISISRRAAVYSVKQIAHLSEDETKTKDFMNDLVAKMEEDTQAILQSLASIQYSKLESARQYVHMAMDDLGFGDIRLESDRSDKTDLMNMKQLNRLLETARPDNLQRAMDQLKKADDWATEVFNDSKNCTPTIRIRAFDIRLFCAALMCWQDPKQWFIKWRRLFEFFFQDRELATLVFCKQKFISKFLARQPGMNARNQMMRLIESLMNVVRQMASETHLEEISNFLNFLESTTRSTRYLQNRGIRWPFVCHLSQYGQSTRALIAARYVFYANGFFLFASGEKTMVISEGLDRFNFVKPGIIWATDSSGRIVCIDAATPDNQTYVNKEHSWDTITCAELTNRVYAREIPAANSISVLDTNTGAILDDESIKLPTTNPNFVFVAAPNGLLFGYNEKEQERYVFFAKTVLSWVTTKPKALDPIQTTETKLSFLNSKILILKTRRTDLGCVLRISINLWQTPTLFLETITWRPDGHMSSNLISYDFCSETIKLFTDEEVEELGLDVNAQYSYDSVWSTEKEFVVLKLVLRINGEGELVISNKGNMDRMTKDTLGELIYRNFTVDEKRVMIPAKYYDRPLSLSPVKYYA